MQFGCIAFNFMQFSTTTSLNWPQRSAAKLKNGKEEACTVSNGPSLLWMIKERTFDGF